MNDPEHEHDHSYIRQDLPGGWAGDSVNVLTGENLSRAELETLELIKKLNNLRRSKTPLQRGKTIHYVPEENIYVMARIHEGQNIVSLFNLNKEEKSINLERYAEVFKDSESALDLISEQSFGLSSSITIPGRKALLLELK